MPEVPPRRDGRAAVDLRPVRIQPGVSRHAEGSALIEVGDTRVLCTASVEERVPPFRRGSGLGWVTAEYAMLPRATAQRGSRERQGASGRSHEIQRLIGRSLRSVVDAGLLGERQLLIDCDVLQADGGTRTAAITGAWVALALAVEHLLRRGQIKASPLTAQVAAVSVGLVDGQALLDLDYPEDAAAETDLNVVMTDAGAFVEVQGTAERRPFTDAELTALLALARSGIATLHGLQRAALAP